MKKKILVVEDEPPILAMLQERLLAEDFDVITAVDGKEALAQVEKGKPDLILLDVMLPKINGYEVLERLKKDKKTAHIPVVMLTALSQPKNVEIAIRLYADKYLTKPIEPAVLVSEIKKTLAIQRT